MTWKNIFKEAGKDFLIGVYNMFCLFVAVFIVCLSMSEKQYNAVMELFIQHAVLPIFFMFLGIVFVGAGVEKVLEFIFRFFKRKFTC